MRRIDSTLLLLLLAAAGAGCSWFEDPSPDRARLVLDGDGGTPVRVVTSVEFLASVQGDGRSVVQLLTADTAYRVLPFDTTYVIRDHQRFFVEVSRDTSDLASIRVQVLLDRVSRFDEEGPLLEDSPFRFVYTFNQRIRHVDEVF